MGSYHGGCAEGEREGPGWAHHTPPQSSLSFPPSPPTPPHGCNACLLACLFVACVVQESALLHALSFPSVERLVYSTCSVHERENERVVMAVLARAGELGYELENAFPSWPRRGNPVFEGSERLVRTGERQVAGG
jgi:hypothetical protein